MEKTFQLDQKEQQVLRGLEQNSLRLNARYGQLRRDQDDIERRITAMEEQQRGFIGNALANRGVDQFDAAQIVNNQLICRVADQPMMTVNDEPETKHTGKPNGVPVAMEQN